jgi:DNA-binding GntR family transcriptional regulator
MQLVCTRPYSARDDQGHVDTNSVGRMVDPDAPTPLYVQVADLIEGMIRDGTIPPNRPIPSETAIQQEYGVARGTTRKAVEVLRERGLVFTVHGKGTYAVENLPEK